PDPPTQRQLNYAKKLGIPITSKMTKDDVSDAISAAEVKNPKKKQQRENINRKQQEKADSQWAAECGPELIAAERKWQQYSEIEEYMIAVYMKGTTTVVDVLRVND